MNQEPNNFFWPSYVDLMTGLFLVALVLFVLTYKTLSTEVGEAKAKAEQVERIKKIEQSVSNLQNGQYFEYQSEYKRHVFKEQVQFELGSDSIDTHYYPFITSAGEKISKLIDSLKANGESNTKYLIIIEGMASKDNFQRNYELSYSRALALYHFWNSHEVTFDNSICEVIIAGSGTGGVGRFEGPAEAKNQRFLIQIIPKVGEQ